MTWCRCRGVSGNSLRSGWRRDRENACSIARFVVLWPSRSAGLPPASAEFPPISFGTDRPYTATKFQLHQVPTMTMQEKRLVKRLKIPPPKDLGRTRNRPRCLGGVFRPPAGGGSHGRSVSDKALALFFCTCRPHPHPLVGAKPLKNIVAWLRINKMI